MNKLLENVFSTKLFLTGKNETIKIHSETSKEQCEFLQKIISKNNFSSSIEIGFAYGISTLAITEEIVKNGGKHVVIDKFELSEWDGVGLDLLSQAGFSKNIEFYEEYCYITLPKLLEQERKFDFAYVDSTKQMDWLMVDFFYLDKLLKLDGIIIYDDVTFPGIRKLFRYITQFPNYRIYEVFPENYRSSSKRKLLSLLKYLPKANYYLKENILKTDYEMGLNSSCIALQKVSEDNRKWDWHKEF
jgi:predicted O-methyltransferase YrrM